MAENVNANIDFTINTTQAVAAMKQLQSQISAFHTQMARGSAATNAASRQMQQNLIDSINATGKFDARLASIQSTTEAFTTSLEKNKFSLGEYFRYAGGASKTFGRMFSKEFSVIEKVATERVKDLQTQFISMGRDANGVLQSIKIRPLALDMTDLGTQTQMAAQKAALLNKLMQQGSTNMLNWGKNTQWAGRQLMVGFTVPLTMLGSIASKTFMDIEEQIIKLRRVYGDFATTVADTDKMVSAIRNLATEFTKYGVAVQDTMALAADVAATGKMGADLIAQVSEATRLAVLGNVKQSEAMQATMSITNAFGVATEDLAKKIDFLNAVENQSVTSIEDLTEAIPKAGPVVQQLGGDVEDLAFFLTAMREGGINAAEGANALKSGLASLINPSNKASQFLQGFGIGIERIVEANKGDIKGLVTDFASALDTLDPLNRARAIEQLFGKFQFSRLSTLFQNVNKQGSQAQRVLGLTQSSAEELAIVSERELGRVAESSTYKFKKSIADFQSALAPVGEEFLKAITPFINMATNILKSFNQMSGGAKQFATNLTLFIGGVGPAVLMTVGLIANGVANLIKFFNNMRNVFTGAGDESENLGESTQYMTQAQIEAAAVASSLDQAHSTLIQTFGVEGVALASLVDKYQKAIAVQEEYRRKTGNFGPSNVGNPPGYANGVVSVPGPKGAGDVVPAMLSPGEAVIPAGMTSKYRPLIQGMISGTLPGYQKGGIIGDTYRIGPTDTVSREEIEQAIRVIAKPPFVGNNVNYELNEALAVFAEIQQRAALARADVYRRQEISDIDKIVDSQGIQSKFTSGLPGRGGSEQLDNYRRTVSETIYDKASEGKPGSEVYGYLKAPVLPFDISEILPIINSVGLDLGINPAEIQQKILNQLQMSNDSILKNPAVGGYGEVDLKFNREAMIASNAQAVIGDTLSSSTDNLLEYNARMAKIKGMPIAKLLSGDYTPEERAAMFGPSNVPGFYEVAIPQSAATLENIDLATLIESTAKRQVLDENGRFVAYRDSQISLDSVNNAQSAFGKAGIPFDTSAYENEAMVSLLTAHMYNRPLPEYVSLDGTPITVEDAMAKFEQVKKGGSSWDKDQMIWQKIAGLEEGGIVARRAVAAFGAHQPFTVAHEMIARLGQEMAATQGSVFKQFTTMQGKSKRSLLEDELKKRLIEESVGVTPEFVNNPFGLMESLSLQGIRDLTLLLGEDRMGASAFDLAAEKYGINLQKVSIPRDPESPSGTQTRLAISNNDVETYKQLVASGATDETKTLVFDQMRTAMGLEEGGIIGGPVPIKIRSVESKQKEEAAAEAAYQGYLASSLAGTPPEEYVRQHAPSTGHSFPLFGVGGMYATPDGRGVFVKPVLTEQDARAEMMGTEIARSGHNLKAPQQRMTVIADPTDLTGTRRFLALESPFDPSFAQPEEQSFTKDQFFKQLVASLVRNDKDLQAANLWGDTLADVGPAGVFNRASGARSITSELPSMEEQAMVNLLGIKGGAKKDFAESTLGLAQSMTAEEYNAGVQAEIQRVLPQLRNTVAGFSLTSEEQGPYQAMIQRLEAGMNVDWSQFHGVHTAVQPRVLKLNGGGILGQGKIDTSTFNTDYGQTPGGFQEVEGIMHYLKKPRNKAEGTAEIVAAELYRRLGGTGLAMKSFPGGVIGSEELPGVIDTYETTLESWIRSQPDPIAASETLLQALSHYAQNDAPINSLLGNIDTHPGNIMFDPVSKKLVNMDLGNSILTGMDTWDSEFSELATDEALAMKERILTAIRVAGGRDNRETLGALALKYGFDNFAGLAVEEPSNKVNAKGKISLLQKLMGFNSNLTGDELLNADPRNNKFIQQLIAENPGLEQRLSFGKLATTSGDSMTESIAQLFFRAKNAQSDSVFKFANGVVSVPGPKGAGDIVPAMLSPGEAVIPTAMTKKYSGLISGMISGNIPGYMAGRDPNSSGARRRLSPQDAMDRIRNAGYGEGLDQVLTSAEAAGVKTTTASFGSVLSDLRLAAEKAAKLPGAFEQYVARINKALQDGATTTESLLGATRYGKDPMTGQVVDPTAFDEASRINPKLLQQFQDEFSHLDTGVTMTRDEALAIIGDAMQSFSPSDQNELTQSQNLSFKSGLGMSLSARSNREMASGSGISTNALSQEMDRTGVEKWATAVKIGGGNLQELTPALVQFDQIIKDLLQSVSNTTGITTVVDSMEDVQRLGGNAIPMDAIAEAALTQLQTVDAAAYDVLNTARNTITEVRADGGVGTGVLRRSEGGIAGLDQAQFIAERMNSEAAKLGEQLATEGVDAFVEGMRNALQVASPSKVADEVGQAVADGVVQGAESKIPDATAAGENVASAIVSPIEAEAEARQVNDIMDQLMSKGATKEDALLKAQNFVNNTPGDGLTADEQQQKNRAGAYKVARTVGLIASGASMLGSFLPGDLGKAAQSAVGPLTAATTAMQMIPGTAGVVAGAIALVGSVFLEVNKSLDETRAKASALTQALGTGAKAMETYATFAGKATASEIMAQRRASAQTGYSIQQGKTKFGRSFLDSEEGQAMLVNVEQGMREIGRTATIQKLGDQLTMAVVSGALSEKQAQSISYSLGQELEDFGFTIGISTRIKDIVGINGRKIEGNQLEIASKITGTAVKDLNGIFNNIQKINADGGMFSGYDLAKLEGQAAGGIIDLVSAQQQIVDSLDIEYSKRIKNLETQGKLNQATALALELESKKTQLINANKTNLESVLGINFDQLIIAQAEAVAAQVKADADLKSMDVTEKRLAARNRVLGSTPDIIPSSQENIAAIESEVIMRARTVFAGTEEETRANTLIDKIRSNTPSELGIVITANLASGNIGLDNLEIFSKLFEGNDQAYTVLATVSASLGGPAADQMIRLLDFFPPGVDAPEKRIKFMTEISTMDPVAAEKTLNALTTLSNYSGVGGLNIQAIMEFYVTNDEKLEDFMARMQELNELKRAGKLNVRSILQQDILIAGSEEAFKDNAEYFNSLDPVNQVLYVQTFLTRFETIGAEDIAAYRATNAEISAGLTDTELRGIMSAEGAEQVTKAADAAARLAKETKKANEELGSFGGVVFDRLTALIDMLNKKLSVIQKKEDKINKKYDERKEALEKIAKINSEISNQQQGQLDIADALARGDVTAAARAIQKYRADASAFAIQQQQEALEKQREAELKTVTFGGETRESIEKKLTRLEMRLAKRDYREALEYLRTEGASANTGGGGSGSPDKKPKKDPPKPPRGPGPKPEELSGNVQKKVEELRAQKLAELNKQLASNVISTEQYNAAMRNLDNELKIYKNTLTANDIAKSTEAFKKSKQSISGYIGNIDRFSDSTSKAMDRVARRAKAGQDFAKGIISLRVYERLMQGLSNGGMVKGYANGGLIPKYFTDGGFAMGTDTVPAMLTPGEFVVSRPAVNSFGVQNLKAINSGKSVGDSVYNYSVTVNSATTSNADEIAQTVIQKIKQVEGTRLRGNRY